MTAELETVCKVPSELLTVIEAIILGRAQDTGHHGKD
jgi:hypothetical protein